MLLQDENGDMLKNNPIQYKPNFQKGTQCNTFKLLTKQIFEWEFAIKLPYRTVENNEP